MAIPFPAVGLKQWQRELGFNIGRNRYVAGYEIQSWVQNAYHKPGLFGRLVLGRERTQGYEVRGVSVVPALGESIVQLRLVRVGAADGEIEWALTASPEKGEARRSEGRFAFAGNREKVIELPAFIPRPGKTTISLSATDLTTKGPVLSATAVVEVPKLLEQFYLHRAKYFDSDKQLSATLRLSGNSDTLSRLTARVSLLRGETEEMASCIMPPIEAARCHLKAGLADLACGNYSVRVVLQNRQQEALCSATRPFVIEEATPAKRGRIKVHVDEPTGRERRAWPVTVGVPFPRCALPVADHEKRVRVMTGKGVEIPCQTKVTATWTEARHFVKWLLVDFQADLPARTGADLFVEYGTEVERQATAPSSLQLAETAEGVQVSTGPLQFSIARREPKFFDSLTLEGVPALAQER